MDESEFAFILSETEQLVKRQVVDRILAGEIAPKPSGKNACLYCPVASCPERLSNEA